MKSAYVLASERNVAVRRAMDEFCRLADLLDDQQIEGDIWETMDVMDGCFSALLAAFPDPRTNQEGS